MPIINKIKIQAARQDAVALTSLVVILGNLIQIKTKLWFDNPIQEKGDYKGWEVYTNITF